MEPDIDVLTGVFVRVNESKSSKRASVEFGGPPDQTPSPPKNATELEQSHAMIKADSLDAGAKAKDVEADPDEDSDSFNLGLGEEEERVGQGTLFGVFLPCCQNILGVILFLRLSWIVGEAGALETFEMVFACITITFSTSISLAAVATNGPVPAGGAYFMISKFLGPEFGGSVGILFYIGTSLGCSMYIVGFAEILLTYLAPDAAFFSMEGDSKFNNFRVYGIVILAVSATIVFFGVGLVTKFAGVALVCVFVAILTIFVGFGYNARGNENKLFCQIGTRIAILENVDGGCWSPTSNEEGSLNISSSLAKAFCNGKEEVKEGDLGDVCDEYFAGYHKLVSKRQSFPGVTSNTLFENIYNLYSHEKEATTWGYSVQDYTVDTRSYSSDPKVGWLVTDAKVDFLLLLGIFFPSVTGIMAGSNRSGDLVNPSFSIPLGTIGAVLTTGTLYLMTVVLYAASIDRLVLRDKLGASLAGGMVAGHVGFPHPKVTEIGALLSTFGAGLQALTGAPRVLAAIANDRLFPYLDYVGVMDKRGNPTRSLLLTTLIVLVGVLIGNLDHIAPLLSMFFILFYAAVNAACVTMSLIDSPNWRPTFRYFHWSVSLVGLVYCIAIMFLIDAAMAFLAFSIFIISYFLVKMNGGELQWGQGIIGMALNFATQSLLMVSKTKENKKHRPWRPQIMAFAKLEKRKANPDTAGRYKNHVVIENVGKEGDEVYYIVGNKNDRTLYSLAHQIKQDNGLVIAVSVISARTKSIPQTKLDLQEMMKDEMREVMLDGLAEVYLCKTDLADELNGAISCVLQLTGVGSLRPNTLMIRFPLSRTDDFQRAVYVKLIQESIELHMSLVSVAQFKPFKVSDVEKGGAKGFVDAVLIHDGDTGLILMLAYLLKSYPTWKRCRIRLLVPMMGSRKNTKEETANNWERYLKKVRLVADIMVFECPNDPRSLNAAVASLTKNSRFVIMSMRCNDRRVNVGNDRELNGWLDDVAVRINNLHNVMLVWSLSPSSIVD